MALIWILFASVPGFCVAQTDWYLHSTIQIKHLISGLLKKNYSAKKNDNGSQ